MPYRVDIRDASVSAFDRLVELGAMDIELLPHGTMAALMPDWVTPERLLDTLGGPNLTVSPALERDAGSVWLLQPRPITVGPLRILPADVAPEPGGLRLIDSEAFGTGLHPTTGLCLEAIADTLDADSPERVLDIGTGSGVLALAALRMGVAHATGIDLDERALAVAARNAHLNELADRLALVHGGPDAVNGTWPLVVANILPAPLIEMAPVVIRRVAHGGLLVLSGIPTSLTEDVARTYTRLGMRQMDTRSRAGWGLLILRASW